MKLTFLGSGDAFGSGGRLQTCILCQSAAGNFLIDCGATALLAIRRFDFEPNAVGMIFLSHLHGDHFAGIPFFILDAQMISKRTAPLVIVGPSGTRQRILDAMEVLFPGSSKTEQKFALEFIEPELESPLAIQGVNVTAFPVVHPSGSPSTALRVECDGKIIAYSGDSEWTETLISAAKGADLLIAESYSFDKPIKFHLNYQALMEHLPVLQVKRLLLTHMSAGMLSRLPEVSCDYAFDGKVVEL